MTEPKKKGRPRPELQCSAHKASTGERCQVAVIKGGTVCVYHGGSAPQVREAANRHLQELVPDALRALTHIVNTESPFALSQRLGAAKDILDRAGTAASAKHEVDLHDSTEERMALAVSTIDTILGPQKGAPTE